MKKYSQRHKPADTKFKQFQLKSSHDDGIEWGLLTVYFSKTV